MKSGGPAEKSQMATKITKSSSSERSQAVKSSDIFFSGNQSAKVIKSRSDSSNQVPATSSVVGKVTKSSSSETNQTKTKLLKEEKKIEKKEHFQKSLKNGNSNPII